MLSTQRRVLRNGGQYRKIIAHNGLDQAFTSPDAANVLLPYSGFREPLAEASWETIPHWPILEITPATGLVSGRLLPNSTLYTNKYTYFTGPQDHRTGRVASMQTWTYSPSSAAKGATYYHYNARGQVLASYGSGTSPAAYIYDAAGRMTHLRTWRTVPSLAPATIDTDLAAAAASAQTTTWLYSSNMAVSQIRTKTYHGSPTSVEYAYWMDGSTKTRKWERTDGANRLLTTYYPNEFGQPEEIHYGSTAVVAFSSTHPNYAPSVLLDYDRAGRLRHRSDGTGITLHTYRYDGSPLTEYTVNGSDVAQATGRHLRRAVDATGRLSTLEATWGSVMGSSTWSTGSPIVSYTYGAADRLTSLTSGGMVGTITRTSALDAFKVGPPTMTTGTYSTYSSVARDAHGRPSGHTGIYTSFKTNYALFASPLTWDADRLASRGETDMTWQYGYDSRSQVATAHKTFAGGIVAAGSQNEYNYDGIGNRTTLKEGGTGTLGAGLRTTVYTAGNLNQYSSVDRPQSFDVTGKRSGSSAQITVNGTVLPLLGSDYQPGSSGLYFRKEVSNTPASFVAGDFFEPVRVTQQIGTGPVSTVTPDQDPTQLVGPPLSAPGSSPLYDADGNLKSDGVWTYTWDVENRLVKMEKAHWTQPAAGYLPGNTLQGTRLTFAYDGWSRRTSKKTERLNSMGAVATSEMEGYLYDGWNLIMISQLNPTTGAHVQRKWSCLWRPDAGSQPEARTAWQEAGGVGGLAWLQAGGSGGDFIQVPYQDHMGNVRAWFAVYTSTGGTRDAFLSASYEYDAFGREVRASGGAVGIYSGTGPLYPPPGITAGLSWADVLPFHSSTKFTDSESGLNYYGYRYYDPRDGRWLSRDPIEEEGGLNLYGMAGNDAVNFVDYIGLATIRVDADCPASLIKDYRYLDEDEQPKKLRSLPMGGKMDQRVNADALYYPDGKADKLWDGSSIIILCICRNGKWEVRISGLGVIDTWNPGEPAPYRWPDTRFPPYTGTPPLTPPDPLPPGAQGPLPPGTHLPPLNPTPTPTRGQLASIRDAKIKDSKIKKGVKQK